MRNLVLSICLLATSGVAYSQSKAAEAAIDKVAALPEVKAFVKTAKRSQPNLIVDSEPDKEYKYYWIKVGWGNSGMFRTWSDFLVDPKTQQIFYLDVFTDNGTKTLTLTQWRKWRKLPEWQQLHYYIGSGKNLRFKACDP